MDRDDGRRAGYGLLWADFTGTLLLRFCERARRALGNGAMFVTSSMLRRCVCQSCAYRDAMAVSNITGCRSYIAGWVGIVRMHVLQSGTHEGTDRVATAAFSTDSLSALVMSSKWNFRTMADILERLART